MRAVALVGFFACLALVCHHLGLFQPNAFYGATTWGLTGIALLIIAIRGEL